MANAADVQLRASLIDDYLQVEAAPVATNLTGRFVALQDPAAPQTTSLVTIAPAGGLVQYMPDQTSHSGWSLVSIAATAPSGAQAAPNRLAGYKQSGVTNLLAYFPLTQGTGSSAVWMQSFEPGTWLQASLTNDSANALGYTFQTDTYVDAQGNQYLYGVSGNISPGAFFLVAYDPTQNAWDVIYEQLVNDFTPQLTEAAAFRLMPGSAGNSFTVLWIDQGILYYQGAQISQGNFNWAAGVPTSVNLGLGPLAVNRILPLPGTAGVGNLLVIDKSGNLYSIQNYTVSPPTATKLSGGTSQPVGVVWAEIGIGAGGMLMLFAKEANSQRLWLLRQTGTSTAGAPTFASWVQLGDPVDAIACPASMQAGSELFKVDLGQNVYHMAEFAADHVWSTIRLAAPSPSTAAPSNIAAHHINATVLDANQTPVAGAVVQVEADKPITVIINELSHQIGPSAPAQVQADPTGSLNIIVPTTSLAQPVVTVTATNTDGSSAQRWCQGDVVQVKTGETAIPACPQSVASRLANNDPTKPLTATSLQSAGLLSSSYTDPSGATTAVTSAGQWMLQHPQPTTTTTTTSTSTSTSTSNTLSLNQVTTKHWQIDFKSPSGPQFTALTEEQGRALVAAAKSPTALGSSTELGDFQSFLGDILNFFKHLWQELESFAVTVIDDVLHLIIQGEAFIVQSLREAANALETVFNRIIEGLKEVWEAILDVINFLKQLFEWDDILVTHNVIKGSINSLLTHAINNMGNFEILLTNQFSTLQSEVTTFFGNLETNVEQAFQAGQTFNQFANAQSSNPATGSGGNALASGPMNTGYAQHGPRCNYVHGRAKTHYSNNTSLTRGLLAVQDPQGISDLVTSNWAGDTFNQNCQKAQNFITNNISDPHNFLELVIVDLLNACQDAVLFVLKTVEDIVQAVLNAGASAIQQLQTSWNATIDIPVVSWLYQNIITHGDPLTVLDLLSLIFAVPTTILYKVLYNGQAPFAANDPNVQQIISQGLPFPPVPTSAPPSLAVGQLRRELGAAPVIPASPTPASTSPGSTSPAAPAATIPASIIEVLGVCGGVATFFGTFINMAADGLAFSPEPLEGFDTFISWASIIQGVASQAFGAPWTQFNEASSAWSTADQWNVGLWGASNIPLIYDSVFTISTGALARFGNEWGPVLDAGAGFVLTGISIVTAVKQAQDPSSYTGWDCASNVISQLDSCFKFLLLTKDTEAEVVAMPLLLVTDLILGVASTVTAIGSTVEG